MEHSENTKSVADLASARTALANERAALREAQDTFNAVRLAAEFALLTEVGGDPKAVGSNDKDRERAYGLYCENSQDFTRARLVLRAVEKSVALHEAALDILKDARRERELRVQERYLELADEKASMFVLPHLKELAS